MTKKILITAAIKDELIPTWEYIKKSPIESIKTDFLITGIGRHKTLKNLNHYLIDNSPSIILNIGTCGSLNSDFKKGKLVMPTSFIAIINDSVQQIQSTFQDHQNFEEFENGGLYTSGTALYKTREKNSAGRRTGADFVDMEAFWTAEFCQHRKIPFIALKVVTDVMQDFSLNEFKQELKQNAQLLVTPVDKLLRTIAV